MLAIVKPQGRGKLPLGYITIAAALLRLPALLNDGMWRDKANIYVQLTAPTFGEFLHRVTVTEWHPPLYFALIFVWAKVAGTSELALQSLPFILSVLTVPLVYRLGKLTSSPAVGLLAAGIYAVSPIAVNSSTEYLYPLMGLLCTLLACLVAEALQEARVPPAHLVTIGLVSAFVVATHYLALIYLPLLALWAITSGKGIRPAALLVSALAAGMLPFAFWLPVFLNQRHIGIPYAVTASVADRAVYVGIALTRFMPVQPTVVQLLCGVLVIVFIPILARPGTVKGTVVALASIVLAALVLLAAANIMADRYIFPLYGLLCVPLAWATTELGAFTLAKCSAVWRVPVISIAAILAVAVVLGDAWSAFTRSAIPVSGIRTLVKSTPRLDRSALYLIAPDYLASSFAFYARNTHVTYRGFVRSNHPEIFRLDGYAADWSEKGVALASAAAIGREAHGYHYLNVIVDRRARDEGQVSYGKVWTLLALLKHHYPLLAEVRYAGRLEDISEYHFLLKPYATRSVLDPRHLHKDHATWQ